MCASTSFHRAGAYAFLLVAFGRGHAVVHFSVAVVVESVAGFYFGADFSDTSSVFSSDAGLNAVFTGCFVASG